jgi:elongation factor G
LSIFSSVERGILSVINTARGLGSQTFGAVIGDLQSRRGSVLASDMKAGAHDIVASVPLANMFSYVNAVRSLSEGRATFTMQLDRYARMPKALQAKLLDPA